MISGVILFRSRAQVLTLLLNEHLTSSVKLEFGSFLFTVEFFFFFLFFIFFSIFFFFFFFFFIFFFFFFPFFSTPFSFFFEGIFLYGTSIPFLLLSFV